MTEEIKFKVRTLLSWMNSDTPRNLLLIPYKKLEHRKLLKRTKLYCSFCTPKNMEVFYICFKCYNKAIKKAREEEKIEIYEKLSILDDGLYDLKGIQIWMKEELEKLKAQ